MSYSFNRVNHQAIHLKLCFVGVVGSVLSVLMQVLSTQSHSVVLDGCCSVCVVVACGQLLNLNRLLYS